MLPPFVPPSVRIASESLPLITEFVVDRVERSFGNPSPNFASFGSSQDSGVATLPSIDEFIVDASEEPSLGESEDFVRRTSRSASGAYEATQEAPGATQYAPNTSAPTAPADVVEDPVEADTLLGGHRPPVGSSDAIVNETVEDVAAWEASAAVETRQDSAALRPDATSGAEEPSAPSQNAPEEWVAQERDAFDWKSVASLAVPPAEDQRAAEEWSSTEWDKGGGTLQDHVSSLLSQIARRVRSGELEIQGSRQMGTEAALVSVLAALLAESEKKD
ncbi:MAG: hypothetical protein M3Z30_08205 [Gemmatimonadota bacterium]|nr:hypothetical protein [Gemmatimonadota bacterium]